MSSFREKVYLLTGASSGIGEATAIKLAEHGATLFLVALEEDKLQIVQQKCIEKGLVEEKIGYCSGDLSQSAFREEIVKNLIQKFGRLDILADIAGYVMFTNVSETKEEDYDRFVNVNQKAKFFLAQLCLPYLKETKGNIIYMSSIRSTIPKPDTVVYCMAKVAIDMLTKCLAKELGPHGVRVNAINPGFIDNTNILRNSDWKATDEEEKKHAEKAAKIAHLKRAGKPEDVVSLLLFLASDEASYITGNINYIDGGSHLYP
ncbi:3-oxoacyl-[acyl-carrier protein] reductase [Mytilus galloprovincialis]|uniref:3-oxoacyl-[acyl-carrier protein] reductase n=1 Tax=Mytilus galloprovincialis TaxID=29158 RepID=A0A8B6BT19_MYTGA|nr:3-oxoacyl-[acyl-carrier protein] reductase [Mytilus galloprovincialis]